MTYRKRILYTDCGTSLRADGKHLFALECIDLYTLYIKHRRPNSRSTFSQSDHSGPKSDSLNLQFWLNSANKSKNGISATRPMDPNSQVNQSARLKTAFSVKIDKFSHQKTIFFSIIYLAAGTYLFPSVSQQPPSKQDLMFGNWTQLHKMGL